MKDERESELQLFNGSMKNQLVLPVILLIAMATVFYGVSYSKISDGGTYIPAFLSMLVALTLPDYLLKFLTGRGFLKAELCQSKTVKAIFAGLLAGAIILPARWCLSPVSRILRPSEDKGLMLIVVVALFILIGLYVTRNWWRPTPEELVEAIEERELMARLKAQGCSPSEILDRLNALNDRRQWIKERMNNKQENPKQ